MCLTGRLETVGSYTNGASALVIHWNAYLVQWPDGPVIATKEFIGGAPPATISGFASGVGKPPTEAEVLEWLLDIKQD